MGSGAVGGIMGALLGHITGYGRVGWSHARRDTCCSVAIRAAFPFLVSWVMAAILLLRTCTLVLLAPWMHWQCVP